MIICAYRLNHEYWRWSLVTPGNGGKLLSSQSEPGWESLLLEEDEGLRFALFLAASSFTLGGDTNFIIEPT